MERLLNNQDFLFFKVSLNSIKLHYQYNIYGYSNMFANRQTLYSKRIASAFHNQTGFWY